MKKIDKVILGTAQLGLNYGINNKFGRPDKESSFHLLRLAKKEGIKTLDTAEAYGLSHEVIGEFHENYKDRYIVNTKFKNSGKSLVNKIAANLKELNIDNINVYFFHNFSDVYNLEILNECIRLKKEQKIQKIGVSVYTNQDIIKASLIDEIDVVQLPFNLLDNYQLKGEAIEKAKSLNKELQVRSVFLQGLFFMRNDELPSKLQPLANYLKKLNNLSSDLNTSIECIALNYCLKKSTIDHVLFGLENEEQLNRNLECLNFDLNDGVMEYIDSIRVLETDLLNPQNW